MCGIAGYIVTTPGKIGGDKLQAIAKDLLLEIESRGRDATGYAYVSKQNSQTYVAKYPVEASDFIKIPGHMLSRDIKMMPRCMILHTRYATTGHPKDNQNNHPIYSKASGMCLVHNGWILNDTELQLEHDMQKDAEVDTETYLRLVEKMYFAQPAPRSVPEAVAAAHEQTYGSLACAMVRGGHPGVLWLWRNQGDLALARTDFGYVFASTMKALLTAVYRNTTAREVTFVEAIMVPHDTLVQIEEDGKLLVLDLKTPDSKLVPDDLRGHIVYGTDAQPRWQKYKSSYTGSTVGYYHSQITGEYHRFNESYYGNDMSGWGMHGGYQPVVRDSKNGDGATHNGNAGGNGNITRYVGNTKVTDDKPPVTTPPAVVDIATGETEQATVVGKDLVVVANPGEGSPDAGAQTSPNSNSPKARTEREPYGLRPTIRNWN